MLRYGDGEKPMWATESGSWGNPLDRAAQAQEYLRLARFYTDREDISGAFMWKFRDDPRELTILLHGEGENDYASGIVEWEFRDGSYQLKPVGIALRDFLLAQREKGAAGG